jgi:hypothetical protein
MALTLDDLKNKMARALNEVEILEVLEITTDQLVDRFEDLILEKYDYLLEELEEGEQEENDDKVKQDFN